MNNTQEQQILNHLKQGKSITPIEALELCGRFRLSAAIYRLKIKGYDIVTHHERNTNNAGTHARYELVQEVAA